MANTLTLPCDVSEVSDGYHTFAELYDHRCILFVNLALCHKAIAFKTRLDDKGERWEGWFILGLNTPNGQITYHLPDALWNYLSSIREVEYNHDYDGHTGSDVLYRLYLLTVLSDR